VNERKGGMMEGRKERKKQVSKGGKKERYEWEDKMKQRRDGRKGKKKESEGRKGRKERTGR